MDTRVTDTETKVTANEGKISGLDTRVTDTEAKVTANEGKISGLDTRLTDTETKVTANEGKISGLDTRLTDTETKVAANEGKISGLDTRLTDTEAKVTANEGKINGLDTRVTDTETKVAAAEGKINVLDTRVTDTEAKVAAAEGKITQNANDLAQVKTDLSKDINENTDAIAKNAENIANNSKDITKLDTRVSDLEQITKTNSTVSAADDGNITVSESKNADGSTDYKVSLAKDITVDSVKAGENVTLKNDGLTVGETKVSNDGLTVGDKTYVSKDGLNANDQKVTNVGAGEVSANSKDAVNGSQLHATNQQVLTNSNRITKLGERVNKVGAGAAALAALHPMDFDPDDKWSFAAGYGNYAGENAVAVGAYYRPDEKVMFSVGGTAGNGENMVNAGISFALDRTSHVSNSRTAMAREIMDLRAEITELKVQLAKGGLDNDKLKLFPDVAENHWAYEYIGKLAANGIIEGYPDGSFGGDRMMSRYEIAAILYRAMQKGAQIDSKIITEFAPELGRIRVDRISGEDNDKRKIERVRVNGTDKEKNDYRDRYGSKIAGK